ncbi:MAG: hypothetical protein ACJAX4_003007 [Clostridium sp.]|jgi:hypothetical protein
MVFHISNDNEIYKVLKSYYNDEKTIVKLSNTTILEVVIFYEVLDRKLQKLINIEFNRCQIDSAANIIDRNDSSALKNFLNYNSCTADELSLHEKIPIPRAYTIPTEKEKQVLYDFLEKKYPLIWNGCSYITESHINKLNDLLDKYKALVKEAYLKKI